MRLQIGFFLQDDLNARRVADQASDKNKMFDRLECVVLILLMVLCFVLVNLLCFQLMSG